MTRRRWRLDISSAWIDDDIVELIVAVASPDFQGQVSIMELRGACARVADAIRDFPRDFYDRRSTRIGSDLLAHDNTISFELSCLNRKGDCAIGIEIAIDGGAEHLRVVIPTQPSAIDEFVKRLEVLEQPDSEPASLNTLT